jgi:hypothetical protein
LLLAANRLRIHAIRLTVSPAQRGTALTPPKVRRHCRKRRPRADRTRAAMAAAWPKGRAKTEAELIATVANIQDAERSLLFAQLAIKAGMPALAAACGERAKALTPIKRRSKAAVRRGRSAGIGALAWRALP